MTSASTILANVYHIALGIRSNKKTYSIRLHNVVAITTTDRDAWPVFLIYLTSRWHF